MKSIKKQQKPAVLQVISGTRTDTIYDQDAVNLEIVDLNENKFGEKSMLPAGIGFEALVKKLGIGSMITFVK